MSGGATAIEVWAELYPAGNPNSLPDQVIEQLISAIERRHNVGLHALLHCACRLVELKRVRADDRVPLDEALGDLKNASSYENIDWDSKDAVSASLVRAECVRLSDALRKAGIAGPSAQGWLGWLELAATDSLPEVRFALS